jgi:anti-anti-sigma factor
MTTEDTGVAVIQPDGDVVAASVPELRSKMRGAIAEGARQLTVDLINVAMIDSAGLGMLIAAHNSLTRVGGELRVTGASQDLLDLFIALRMHQHFSVSGRGETSESPARA